jgi:peptide/nickel transport system substrate-binding protein
VPWDTDECPYPYDPDMARSLLEEAGVTDLEVDFPYPEAAWHPIMAQVFQAEMADIGITVNLQNQDLATWLDQVNTQGQFDIYQITAGWTLPEFACAAGLQPFGHPDQVDFCDEGMDALIEGIDAIVDYDEYVARQQELDRYVAEQGWIFATKKPNVPTLFRSDLVGLVEHRLPDIHIDVRGLHWAE